MKYVVRTWLKVPCDFTIKFWLETSELSPRTSSINKTVKLLFSTLHNKQELSEMHVARVQGLAQQFFHTLHNC